jgi:serine/threonine-protein kinase
MGIIHRDVKPGNLMVIGGPAGGPPEMTVKLADFGIARAAEQTRLTQVGSVVGTAAYLSPEQSRGEEATPISDVYSLGVVTYQLLTARLPYEGNSLAELAIRRENERPLPPTSYDKDIPESLSAAVLRALENEPEERYVDALAYGAALRAGLAGIAPASEATTRIVDQRSTAATRVAPREPRTPTSPARPARPRRTSPPPRRAPIAAAQQPRKRSRFGSFVRGLLAVLMIAIVAGLIAAVILLATDAGQSSDIGRFISDNVDEQVQNIKDYINQATGQ